MTIRFIKSWNGYYEGQIVTNPAGGNSEATLISLGYAVSDLDGPDKSGDPVTVSADRTIAASDDGKVFNLTVAATLTIPASLSPRPSFIVNPPASGNVSIAVSGGANINGATTTLTRARSANVAGFAVVAYAESDGYGVSGS